MKSMLAKKYQINNKTFISGVNDLLNNQANLINLTIGDLDLDTAAAVIEEATADALAGYTHYSHPQGDKELCQAIINYHFKKDGITINEDELMITVGACHGTYLTLEAILDPDDEVIIPAPYFPPYISQVELAGGKAVLAETNAANGYQLDLANIDDLINKNTKAILINSPHNPTGVIQSNEVLDKLIDLAKKHQIIILSDEVYANFDYLNKFKSIKSLAQAKYQKTIIFNSFSKIFAMTGWRVGYVIAPAEIIDAIKQINEGVCYSAPTISQRAALAALRQEKSISREIVNKFAKRVEKTWQFIKSSKWLKSVKAEGAFYYFIDISASGLKSTEFTLKLLKTKHVFVLPGSDFGDQTGNFVRIACTKDIALIKEALIRIDDFIGELREKLVV